MSLNRYRLDHRAKQGHLTAQRIQGMLRRVDRLLGVILIGNTLANVWLSAVTTLIASHYFGDMGAFTASLLLTMVILIVAEITPKTYTLPSIQNALPFRLAAPYNGALNSSTHCFLRQWHVDPSVTRLWRSGTQSAHRYPQPR